MPDLRDLKETMRAKALEAHEIVKDESTTTAEKLAKLKGTDGDNGLDAEIKALSEQIAAEIDLAAQRSRFDGIINGSAEPDKPVVTKSVSQQVTDSPAFQRAMVAWKAGVPASSEVMEIDAPMGLKAAVYADLQKLGLKASLESGLGSANFIVQDRVPGIIPILFERLTIADLMPSRPVNGTTVRVGVQSTATNNAATVAEGAAKPASVLNWTVVDEPIRKVATINKISDEFLEDVPSIGNEVSGQLTMFVGLQEEAQILAGDGTGQNLTGILNRAGLTAAQAKGADSIAIAVHKEITKIRIASFLEPDAIVWHPNDWQAAMFEQDANGQFYGPGPFTGPYGQPQVGGGNYAGNYWGKRAVVTTAETENTVLVGGFASSSELLRRKGITVVMSNVDADDFTKNLMTIRAESRLGLRVIRPAAFGLVTGV